MSLTDERACLSRPEVLMEQFIPDHVFVYVTRGTVNCYDGSTTHVFSEGQYFIARKNRLARYYSEKGQEVERRICCFEESFLRSFTEKHKQPPVQHDPKKTFIKLAPSPLIPAFIHSLQAYTDAAGRLNEAFEDLKYEELLIILLQNQPGLANILFDFARPEKIDLEEFMNRNFAFNVRLEQFAYLTGRSLSAFKRDFKTIFNTTPQRWLMQRRLQEAHFLITRHHKKASEIYLDLGFEDLSHFSFAFKRQFGLRPTELRGTP